MNTYRVDVVHRGEDKQAKTLELREGPSGYTWLDLAAGLELQDVPAQPTIMKARRVLEVRYLYTHEIHWPAVIPRKPGAELVECPICLRLPRSLVWELKLIAGLSGKPFATLIRNILIHYTRPGTLPPLDETFINQVLEDRKAKGR